MENGIKELTELLEVTKVIGVGVAKVAKDGKVNVDDLPIIMQLVGEANQIVEGFKGLGELPAEVKDLEVEELREIVNKAVDIYAEIQAALK